MSALATEPEWEFTEETQFLFEPSRYKVGYGGRGGVKSWSFARALLIQGYQQPLRILCVREVQESIKESVHRLLSDQIQLLGLGGFYEVLTKEIRGRNGTTFVFTGLSNLTAESIKSYEGVDRVWAEEARSVTRRSWDILTPTIRKEGSEIWVTFNPELDTDETWVRFVENTPDDAVVVQMSHANNPWFPDVLEQERLNFLRQVDNGSRERYEYDNIWEGKCKPAIEGAVYGTQVAQCIAENRLTHVPHDPTLYTHLIFDVGYDDDLTIGFVQKSGASIRFIDYIEDSHRTYESYVKQIREVADAKGYRIAIDGKQGGKAWLPHDAKQTRVETGKSGIELVNSYGLKAAKDGVPNIGIKGRIEAGRSMFGRALFDKQNCLPLFNKLRRFARKISKETGQAGGIKKDGNDHAGDMYTYAAVIEKELTNESDQIMKPISYDNRGIV